MGVDWDGVTTDVSVFVDADVDLNDFGTKQLLKELIDRGLLNEAEATRIFNRDQDKLNIPTVPKHIDEDELDRALFYMRTGNKGEGVEHLENALGWEWRGRLS